jgi:hypothetical protein
MNGGGELTGNVPVYLIFANPGGTGTFGPDPTHPLAISDITNAVATILNSGYLSDLSEYGAANQAFLAGTFVNTDYALPTTYKANNDNSNGGNNSDINNLVSDSLKDNRNDNTGLPEPDDTSTNGIYAVFTPLGYKLTSVFNNQTSFPAGIHSDGNTGGFLDPDDADDLVIPTYQVNSAQAPSQRGTNPPQTTNMSAIDTFTATFSHELVEDLTDAASQGPSGISVAAGNNYLPSFPFAVSGPAEIGDNEAQLYVGYENGVAVQAYWSQQNNAFIIPGSATQNRFALNSQKLVVSGGLAGPLMNAIVSISTTGSGGVQVIVNGETVQYGPGQVTSIDVSFGGGTNTVDLQSIPPGVTSITIEGAGNTTLKAPSGATNVWHNTGVGSGTLDINGQVGVVSFTGITNESGGGSDDFMFQGGSVPGFVDGGPGPGVASLDYSALAGPVTVDIQTGTADDIGTTFTNINNFVGSASPADTLVGPDATWDISSANSGTVNGLTFSSFENLTGGTGPDQFVFLPGGSVSGNIDGGAGANTLDYSALPGPVTVNLQSHTASDIGGTFANISNFIGSASSADTLIGPDAGATWDITGGNSGSVNGSTFSSFENLTGGNGPDQFVFFPGGGVSGNIDGGGGSNTLDYSHLTTPVTLNLQNHTATGIGGTFANITNFVGGSGSNTLVGPNADTVWTLTGLNMFTVNGLGFSGFQNLVGGSGADRFVFETGGGVSGTIDGGGGNNTLDYSPFVGDIVVDLPLGVATGVGQGVVHVENVTGSIGNDLLVGDAFTNDLIGGTGRSIIIGGLGADQVVAGAGECILIGGTTAYDTNLTALSAIMKEWTRTDLSFQQRLADLISNAPPARALNGPYHLNKDTVFDDGSHDVLVGGVGLDWYFANLALDTIDNQQPGDHVTGV